MLPKIHVALDTGSPIRRRSYPTTSHVTGFQKNRQKIVVAIGLPLLLLWLLLLTTALSEATPVVSPPESVAGEMGQVAGTITTGDKQTPAGLTVILAVTPTVNFGTVYYTVTNGVGHYDFPAVLPLSYTLQVVDLRQVYANTYYDGAAHPNQATAISVNAGSTQLIDIALTRGAAISGTVTVAGDAPYRLYLLPYRWTGTIWQPLHFFRQEQVGNHYRLAGLLAGRYRLGVTAILADGDTRHEGFYGGATLASAADIDLRAGATHAGLDIELPKKMDVRFYLPLIHQNS